MAWNEAKSDDTKRARARRFGRLCRRGHHLSGALVLALLGPSSWGSAETTSEADSPARLTHTQFEVRTASSAVRVDGVLDEAAWQTAATIPLPFETRPAENSPADITTECLLTFSDSHFYIAFRAQDPDPKSIVARFADRDAIFSDDIVGVILDPFNDERRGFQFFVNPLGIQMDAFLDGVSGEEDTSWDAIWRSSGRITETGFIVEMAIPFSSLRFPDGDGSQTWGIDVVRWQPRADARRFASQKRDRNISCHLCQVSKITGLEGITPGRNLEITPTITANRSDRRQPFLTGDFDEGSVDSDAGLSVRWGITPNINLNVTANPDFSQVEADAAQLDLNEQFALFFPEKRPFFLEGSDIFNTSLRTVSTRNVADPDWGVKLTGKQGRHTFGLFSARDQVTQLIFPGSERSSGASLDQSSTDSVLRYRVDLGANSNIGVLLTDRQGEGFSSSLAGVDLVYRPSDQDTFAAQLLRSTTEYPRALAEQHDQPLGDFDDWAGRASYNHEGRNWEVYTIYESMGRDFRADMGFIPQVNYRKAVAGLGYTWVGDETDWYRNLELGGDWDHTEDQSGNLLEREVEMRFEVSGPLQSFAFLGGVVRDRAWRGELFEERMVFGFGEIRPWADLRFNLEWRTGNQIDLANSRLGDGTRIEPGINFNVGRHLAGQMTHEHRLLDVEGGRLFTADLSQLTLTYQFNRNSFVRAITQYANIERNPALYTFAVEEESEDLFTQLLFSYKLNPQTVFFLGYSDTSFGDQEIALTRQDRTLFLKVGYAWVL